jgi:uncharacterized FlaG/YvyC family protein
MSLVGLFFHIRVYNQINQFRIRIYWKKSKRKMKLERQGIFINNPLSEVEKFRLSHYRDSLKLKGREVSRMSRDLGFKLIRSDSNRIVGIQDKSTGEVIPL